MSCFGKLPFKIDKNIKGICHREEVKIMSDRWRQEERGTDMITGEVFGDAALWAGVFSHVRAGE